MPEQHGGYRKPNNPAPVSGPGQLSQRTDGGPADAQPVRDLTGGGYGESKELRQVQSGAPMAEQEGVGAPSLDGLLDEPSQRPDEALTAGAPFGEGVGPEAAGMPPATSAGQDAKNMRELLPMLEFVANSPGSNPSTRKLVRTLKGSL